MRILRLREVLNVTGLSRSTVYEHINKTDFPKPVSLGDRAVGWVDDEIQHWLESRVQQRDNQSQDAF